MRSVGTVHTAQPRAISSDVSPRTSALQPAVKTRKRSPSFAPVRQRGNAQRRPGSSARWPSATPSFGASGRED